MEVTLKRDLKAQEGAGQTGADLGQGCLGRGNSPCWARRSAHWVVEAGGCSELEPRGDSRVRPEGQQGLGAKVKAMSVS